MIAAATQQTGCEAHPTIAPVENCERRSCHQHASVDAVLATVGHELVCAVNTADCVPPVCRLTVEALQCDYSCLLLWRPREAAYVPAACHGVRDEDWATLRGLQLSRAVMSDFIARLERETIIQMRAALVSAAPSAPLMLKYGASASIHAALRRGTETIGVLVAGYRQRPERFTRRHVHLARGIAQLASVTLEIAERAGELQHASLLKSELVATVSHELRTPLNILIGYNELLLDHTYGSLTRRQRATLQQVDRSAHELLDVINGLLDLSCVEHGRIALDLCETDIAEVLHEIDVETQPLRQNAGLAFVYHVPPALASLRTDPAKLKVVLKNLIVNAFKFTDRGSVTVAVGNRGGGIEISVADTGIGMAPETLDRIFEPFQQAGGRQQRAGGGVGLGLFIVSRILGRLGGTICVDSALGCGSTFRVWLPSVTAHRGPSRC